MPLTSDPEIIRTFADALTPEAMPVDGEDLPAALALAQARLQRAQVPGSIVVFADDVDPEQLETIRAQRDEGGVPVHVVATAAGPEVVPPAGSPPAPPLDEARMKSLARAGAGGYYPLTPDDSDMQALAADVERGIRSAPGGAQDQWRDTGFFLLPLLILLILPFFRPGGGVVLE